MTLDIPTLQAIVRTREARAVKVRPAHSLMPTPRQLEVARLISEGYTDPEISRWLHITEATAKTHTSALLRRCGARTRAQAVAVCIHEGWLD